MSTAPKSAAPRPMLLHRIVLAATLAAAGVSACGDETSPTPGDVGGDPSTDVDVSTDADGGADVVPDGDAGVDGDASDDVDADSDTATDAGPDAPLTPPELSPGWLTTSHLPQFDCEVELTTAGDRCEAVAGSGEALLLRGTVLAAQGVYSGGGVLLVGDRIACVGCDCDDAAATVGATVVTCPDGVISPGLINAHDHITFTQNFPYTATDERYEHRHEWRRGLNGHTEIPSSGGASGAEMAWGELRQVLGGTTSLAGSGEAVGFLRNLDRSGAAEIGQGTVSYETFPLGDSNGSLRTDDCSYPGIDSTSVLAADCYLAHVSEGIDEAAENEFACVSSSDRGGVDLTEPNSAFVHMIGLTGADAERYAREGGAVVWSPRSNITLYGHTAQVTLFTALGVPVALGTDWTPTGSISILRELACVRELNERNLGSAFDAEGLWRMVTSDAALALHVDDAIGSLRAGLYADIAVFDGAGVEDPYEAVVGASTGDVALVIRGGHTLFGDTAIVDAWAAGGPCEPLPGGVCGVDASVCMNEFGGSFDSLAAGNESSYGLFFCDTPDREPSCVPFRDGEFDGIPTEDDRDGDGVPDADDNCPQVFNAVRPIDGGVQGDLDGDGVGDVCDPCPALWGLDCARPDPTDRDGDGQLNGIDNCPTTANADQADQDSDGVGDACDVCPLAPNPGGGPCPATIYEVKDGTIPVGQRVSIEGVVTAMEASRMFLQVPDTQWGPSGARRSAIMVYHGGAEAVAGVQPGDLVRVGGTVAQFFDQLQLSGLTGVEILDAGYGVPVPLVVDPAAVATGGADAEDYEALLVSVQAAAVTDVDPPLGTGDTAPSNQFVLAGSLRVDDRLYLIAPFPEVGEVLDVTGPVWFANGNMQLTPRDADDVRFVVSRPPRLVGFGPSRAYLHVGLASQPTYPEALTVRVDRPAPASGTTITVTAEPAGFVTIDPVVIAPGEMSATVYITGVADSADPLTLTATDGTASFTSTLTTVAPGRSPSPTGFEPALARVAPGGTVTIQVLLDIPADGAGSGLGVVVGDPFVATVASDTIDIAPFAQRASLVLTAVDLGTTEAIVTGGAGSLSLPISVEEITVTGLRISEVFYDADTGSAGDNNLEWVELYNATGATVDLGRYVLGYGGGSYASATYALSGTLADGGCVVVGGPTSSADNYSPTFAIARVFSPNIQNAGSRADAVGLFEGTPTASSVPIDTVIYGTNNEDSFLGVDGTVGAVNAPDVPAGASVEQISTGWRQQDAPSPGVCAIAFE
ncbi:MAG: amidohydrolase family protein [Myxococcales bacterium]|nr:amidohydrolase family protein [Myxococcales bacterium]MCB9520135.1 amidohydrolase family protein [Myxococcales bacterium]MCB9531244.1 amidohydrolase family protein [Myxococcales bacterium]